MGWAIRHVLTRRAGDMSAGWENRWRLRAPRSRRLITSAHNNPMRRIDVTRCIFHLADPVTGKVSGKAGNGILTPSRQGRGCRQRFGGSFSDSMAQLSIDAVLKSCNIKKRASEGRWGWALQGDGQAPRWRSGWYGAHGTGDLLCPFIASHSSSTASSGPRRRAFIVTVPSSDSLRSSTSRRGTSNVCPARASTST